MRRGDPDRDVANEVRTLMTLVSTPAAPLLLQSARRSAAVALPGGAMMDTRLADSASRLAAVHLFAGISVLLVGGIAVSIFTAPDHSWWHLYFSQLGTVTLFSGFAFNVTLMAAGLLIFLLAARVRREVRAHAARVRSARRAPAIVSTLVGSMGLHLSMVGMVPINTIKPLHDWGALGIMISFVVLLIVTPITVRGLGREFLAMNLPAGILLVGGFVSMYAGLINLTLFELLGFGAMFTWLSLFFGCLVPRAHRMRAADMRAAVRAGHRQVRVSLPGLVRRLSAATRTVEDYTPSPRSLTLSSSAPAVAVLSWPSPVSSTCTVPGASAAPATSTAFGAFSSAITVSASTSTAPSGASASSVTATGPSPAVCSASVSPVSPTDASAIGVSMSGPSSIGGTAVAAMAAIPAVADACRARRSLRVSSVPVPMALAA